MKVSELVNKLTPFCRADMADEPTILIAADANDQFAGVMPFSPDTVKYWEINDSVYILIFKDPNKKKGQ